MGDFPSSVAVQPAPAVEGDFASTNPRFMYDAGPGGLVTGASGVTIGRFVWTQPYPVDTDYAPQVVNNFGSGSVAGIVHREQQALITTYLSAYGMTIPAGFAITVATACDIWVKNAGTGQAIVGQKAYANYATGAVTFAATGSATTSATSTASTISAQTASVTASISGNTMTVTAIGSGTLVAGSVISGSAGSAGGAAVITGTTIVSQVSGSVGGTGVYYVSIGEQNVTSTTVTTTYGLLTIGGSLTGTFAINGVITGTGVTTGSTITGLGTGVGGAGTYYTQTQAMSSSAVNQTGNVETKWFATSSGAAGELVKISSHALG